MRRQQLNSLVVNQHCNLDEDNQAAVRQDNRPYAQVVIYLNFYEKLNS